MTLNQDLINLLTSTHNHMKSKNQEKNRMSLKKTLSLIKYHRNMLKLQKNKLKSKK